MSVKRALSLTAACVQKQLGQKYTIGPNQAYGLIVFPSAKTSINDSLWMSPFECFLHSWWSRQRAESYSEKKNTDFDVWHFHLHQRLTATSVSVKSFVASFQKNFHPDFWVSEKPRNHCRWEKSKRTESFCLSSGAVATPALPFPQPPPFPKVFLSLDDLVSASRRNWSCGEEHNSTSCPLSDKFPALVSCFPLSSKSQTETWLYLALSHSLSPWLRSLVIWPHPILLFGSKTLCIIPCFCCISKYPLPSAASFENWLQTYLINWLFLICKTNMKYILQKPPSTEIL